MRPIDADVLMEKRFPLYDGSQAIDAGDVENAPTLDVVPIVHIHAQRSTCKRLIMAYNALLTGQIKELTALDVVPIVRCKDCVYASDNCFICEHPDVLYGDNFYIEKDFYCARGEKRD